MKIDEFSRASIEHSDRNEDAVFVFAGDGTTAPVFAVIDGMGGHQRETSTGQIITGRDASQMVRTVLMEHLQHLPVDVSAEPGAAAEQKAVEAIKDANQRLFTELNCKQDYPINQRVGAVATVAVVCENGARLLVAQVGDTRGYLFSEDDLIQLCEDDDNVAYLVKKGKLSEEDGQRITQVLNTFDGINEPKVTGTIVISGQPYEMYMVWRWFLVGNAALNIPGANVVINALGIDGSDPVLQTSRIELAAGDALFLCSDGIYKNLADGELTHSLKTQEKPASQCGEAAYARSQDEFNRRSTKDDISAVYVQF